MDNNNRITKHQINYSHLQTNITSFQQLPTFTTANKLLISYKFLIDLSNYNKNKKQMINLAIGDKICIIKPSSSLVCETIVRGHLPKRHGGLESPTVYVLVADNKFDFYKIVDIANTKYRNLDTVLQNTIVKRVFTIYQLEDFLTMGLEKDIKKFKSKLIIITGDFFLRDEQISKQDKERLYPQMIKAIKEKIKDSIILIFSPIKLPDLMNYK